MPRVCLIILNWQNWSETVACLDSLRNLNYPPEAYQIILIDNGSLNDSVSRLETYLKKDSRPIVFLKTGRNLGFAGGNNFGLKWAERNHQPDYFLLLNNDTLIESNFLKKLVEAGESNKKIGLLGPKIYLANSSRIWFAGGKIDWWRQKAEMRGYGELDQGQYDFPQIQETDFISGCCLLIKKEVIESVGLLPEEYFLYYEDVDFSWRVKKAGFGCVFVPSAIIWHKESKSIGKNSDIQIYYLVKNGLVFFSRFSSFYLKIWLKIRTAFRFIYQLFKWIFWPKERKQTRLILKGILDFYSS